MENNKVLARVGNKAITEADVEMLLKGLDPQRTMQFNSEMGRKQLLEELINQELVYLDALEKEFDKEEEYLKELERLKSNVLKQYALHKILKDVTVAEGEVLDYYNDHRDNFKNPESMKASHILVATKEEAEKIIEEINENLSFEEAASQYSQCPSKSQGGDLGYFTRGRMVPEFEEAAFSMEKNEISEPIKTQFGYHIIKVTDKKEAELRSFDEVKQQLVQQLTAQKQQQVYLEKMAQLKTKFPITME